MKTPLIRTISGKRQIAKNNFIRHMFPSQFLPGLITVLLFTAMLFSPKAVFSGAEEGLLLWFQIVFPTLFPFMLISNLLMEYQGLELISKLFSPGTRRIFAVSGNGSFAVLAGFLCGYPMGAKVTADLIRTGRITVSEGGYLLSFCNNTSPVFIMNFIVWKTLGQERFLLPSLIILMGTPALMSLGLRRYYLRNSRYFSSPSALCRPASGPGKKENGFDSCMMNGFEGIVKVGGYIIFFSILIELLNGIPGSHPALDAFMPFLEITNGSLMIHRAVPDIEISYPLIIGLASFGGFCSVAQTRCMIQGTGLKLLPYIIQKLAAGMAASFLAYLYVTLL